MGERKVQTTGGNRTKGWVSAKLYPGCGLGVPPRRLLRPAESLHFSISLVAVPSPNKKSKQAVPN